MKFINFFKFLYKFKFFKRIVPSILRKINKNHIFNIYNFKINGSLSDSIERETFLTGFYDKDRFDFLNKFVQNYNFEYFYDIGSYIGFYSLYFSHFIKIPNVISFEPNEINFKRLKNNIDLNNSNIISHNIGCSNFNGNGKVWFNDINKTGGSSVINPKDNEILKYDCSKIIYRPIQLKTLDSMYEDIINKNILIKIDVERYEINVLEGSSKILKNNNVLMQIEAMPEQKKIVFEFLYNYNYYHISSIDNDHFFTNFIKL